jgi:hypothetical protein
MADQLKELHAKALEPATARIALGSAAAAALIVSAEAAAGWCFAVPRWGGLLAAAVLLVVGYYTYFAGDQPPFGPAEEGGCVRTARLGIAVAGCALAAAGAAVAYGKRGYAATAMRVAGGALLTSTLITATSA